jgi:hypothetical protein
MTRTQSGIIGLIVCAAAGCSTVAGSAAAGSEAVPSDGSSPATASAAMPAAASSGRTAFSGTNVDVTIGEEISPRKYSAGHTLLGSVSNDVYDTRGRVVIPAGSPVNIEITRVSPPAADDTRNEGSVEFTVTSVIVNGASHDARTIATNVPHLAKGRGTTKAQGIDAAQGTHISFALPQAITVK